MNTNEFPEVQDSLPYVIAIDFDGCLCKDARPGIGEPNEKIIKKALGRQKYGAYLILWTDREGEDLEAALDACREWGITFDAVNKNEPTGVAVMGRNPRKIVADEYWPGTRYRPRNRDGHDPALPTTAQLEAELERVKRKSDSRRTFAGDVCKLLTIIAVFVLVTSLLLPFLRIQGNSMEPTLAAGDVVVAVRCEDPEPGDVIGFRSQGAILVKRIIAVKGDEIDMDDAGNVFVNGQPVSEPYVSMKARGDAETDLPCQVPEGCVFVLGDHRSVSVDSRSAEIGCVSEESIIGEVVFRIWPLGRFGSVE